VIYIYKKKNTTQIHSINNVSSIMMLEMLDPDYEIE